MNANTPSKIKIVEACPDGNDILFQAGPMRLNDSGLSTPGGREIFTGILITYRIIPDRIVAHNTDQTTSGLHFRKGSKITAATKASLRMVILAQMASGKLVPHLLILWNSS
jgi:hypothetical protein